METTQENTKHFILHLHKGLADELLGSYTLKERNKEIKRLESTHDEVYHYFIPISVYGKIQSLDVDGLGWAEGSYQITPDMKDLKVYHISLRHLLKEKQNDIGYLKPEGKILNEPETWAIDYYVGGEVEETFLYESKHEYENDLKKIVAAKKPEGEEGGYTIIPCGKCGKDFKKDAMDFLLGLTEEENTICPECSDMGLPVKFINYYKCVCGKKWESAWSCECNSKCPKCNSEIEPYKTEDITMQEYRDSQP